MNGFIKILEAVIASILILISYIYIMQYQIPQISGDISRDNKIKDMLIVLLKTKLIAKAVQENNITIILPYLEALKENIDLEVQDIPPPLISIVCNCSQSDYLLLLNSLLPFENNFKNRKINLSVRRGSVEEDADIILFMDYNEFHNVENLVLTKFLQGRNIVLVSNISEQALSTDDVLKEIFSLKISNLQPTNKNKFVDISNFANISYKFNNYFTNVYLKFEDNEKIYVNGSYYTIYICFNETNYIVIDSTCETGERIYANDVFYVDSTALKLYNVTDIHAYIGIIERDYQFVFQPSSPVLADENTIVRNENNISIMNTNVKDSSRALWMAKQLSTDMKQLLKASILWASGEKYKLISQSIPEEYKEISLFVPGYNIIEPFTLVMKYW